MGKNKYIIYERIKNILLKLNLSPKKYEKALKKAGKLSNDELADHIWQYASERQRCTNGGHYAYMCPFHCGCHEVSFTYEGDDDENQ